MSARTVHRLDGLEPDNLLAFLALLGLLRALELRRPGWHARAYWDLGSFPLRPVLTTSQMVTQADLVSAVVEATALYKRALRPFSWPRSRDDRSKRTSIASEPARHRVLQQRCLSALNACRQDSEKRAVWRLRCDLLASSAATRVNPRDRTVALDATPIKLPSGQMAFIGAQFEAVAVCQAEHVINSLFRTWSYDHKGSSLRLSPEDARRYAYRANDPSPEGSRNEVGASALGALGLLALTMSEGSPQWKMVGYLGRRTEGTISWPIWDAQGGSGCSLHTILAMLRSVQPSGTHQSETEPLISLIATARRYVLDPSTGDYGNVNRADLRAMANGRRQLDRQ